MDAEAFVAPLVLHLRLESLFAAAFLSGPRACALTVPQLTDRRSLIFSLEVTGQRVRAELGGRGSSERSRGEEGDSSE